MKVRETVMAAQLAAKKTRPLVLPALIAGDGDRAAPRFFEFSPTPAIRGPRVSPTPPDPTQITPSLAR